jgi:hypothetical protein
MDFMIFAGLLLIGFRRMARAKVSFQYMKYYKQY